MTMIETAPSPCSGYCDNPHWWHSVHSAETEIEVSEFLGGLVRLVQPEITVESGTLHGQTAEQLALALQKNGHGKLWTIEPNQEFWAAATERLAGLPVECVLTTIEDWTPPGQINFLFLDSNGDRFLQFEKLLPFLAPGAVFAVHDSLVFDTPESRRMVEQIKNTYGHLLCGIDFITPRGLFVGRMI